MNPPAFHRSKVDKDPYEFMDEVQKITQIIGVTSIESVYLAAYQLKGVPQIWYKQWKEGRQGDVGLVEWDEFVTVFLDRFFPREMREAKAAKFINLRQNDMTV